LRPLSDTQFPNFSLLPAIYKVKFNLQIHYRERLASRSGFDGDEMKQNSSTKLSKRQKRLDEMMAFLSSWKTSKPPLDSFSLKLPHEKFQKLSHQRICSPTID
jgi:hypothetical protein